MTSLIGVLTLSLGLVCFLLALGVAVFWTSAERHFEKADRTIVISSRWHLIDGSASSGVALPKTPHPVAAYLKSDFPQIESVARVVLLSDTVSVRVDAKKEILRGFAADSPFFNIFELPFVEGDPLNALSAPFSAVLSLQSAQSLFGDTSAIGKTLTLYEDINVVVTGVLDQIPEPSHIGNSAAAPLHFDFLVTRDAYEVLISTLTGGKDTTQLPEDWFTARNTTYVLLPNDGSFVSDDLARELPRFVDRHVPERQRQLADFSFDVLPVGELLGMGVRDTLFPRLRAESIPRMLFSIGLLVLAVACINFANLNTATAVFRVKEVGVRKTVGARPAQVLAQYLFESAMITFTSLIVALFLIELFTPVIWNISGIDLGTLISANSFASSLLFLLLLVSAIAVASGFYPAVVLSKTKTASVLTMRTAKVGSLSLSFVLVGIQFFLASFLLIFLSIVFQQNRKLQLSEEEIAGDSLLVIENTPELTGVAHDILRQDIGRIAQVSSATTMATLPWSSDSPGRMMLTSSPSSLTVEQSANVYVIGHDFFTVFGIKLIAGRLFDSDRSDDVAASSREALGIQSLVVSDSLASKLGYDGPEAIVNKTVYMPTSVTGESSARSYTVIGVVEDRNLSISNQFGLNPAVYLFIPDSRYHVVRLTSYDAIESIESMWQRLSPNVGLYRRFVSEYFQESYANFRRLTQGFGMISVIAWFISTIGLYGMSILISSQRTREIAIRKTIGASRIQITLFLMRNFSLPVLLANVFAWPFAYIAGSKYLETFDDPVALSFWPFILALIASLLIAWATVGGQAWRAASVAPQHAMRGI